MKIISKQVESNVESIREKNSEKEFYKYIQDKLPGIGITKIVPFTGIYIDLLYKEDGKLSMFKFMDTTEDTFSIFSEEILEVMEEEYLEVKNQLKDKEIPYYFVMPYVNLKEKGLSKEFIIDNHLFEEIINDEVDIKKFLGEELTTNVDEVIFELAKEYFLIKKQIPKSNNAEIILDSIEFRNKKLNGILMDDSQIENINNLKYGATLLLGATGTGKTAIMFAKAIKMAKIYPKDKFLYISFDKQLGNELTKLVKYLYPEVNNLKIINFHQYILLLGKKYNLRLNNKSKQSFSKEFYKVFAKVAKIYQGKRYYKGIFVDEAENFTKEEIDFLRAISYQTKNFLYISYDKAKRLATLESESCYEYDFDNILTLDNNYRSSKKIAMFNMEFQNKVEAFSALEIGEVEDYFIPFGINNSYEGDIDIIEYNDSNEMMENIVNKINELQEIGYKNSEICILYPFNTKVVKGQKNIYSQNIVKKYLEENEIEFNIADDDKLNFQQNQGITLSNIYNINNLEYKVVFFCQLDVLFSGIKDTKSEEAKKILNILYIGMSRASERQYIYLKEDDNRSGIADLLKLTFQEDVWSI